MGSVSLIINAMNIGAKLNGIGRYTLEVVRFILQDQKARRWFEGKQGIVYINEFGLQHFKDEELVHLQVFSQKYSPDYGFKAHLKRLVFSNWHFFFSKKEIITTSPLEISFTARNQVLTIHDLIPMLFKSMHKKQYFYFKHILPRAARRMKKIITVSEHSKNLIIRHYGVEADKVKAIHLGFINSKKKHKVKKEKFFLFVGRLVPTKNIDRLIAAFQQAELKNYQLKLVGFEYDHSQFSENTNAIIENLGERLEFKGYVTDDELSNLYRSATGFLFPSLYEGFGLPPLEAMAQGTATAVSRVSSLPEVCADASLYFNPEDVSAISQSMLALTKKSKRDQLIQKGLKQCKKFSWPKAGKEHFLVYAKVFN